VYCLVPVLKYGVPKDFPDMASMHFVFCVLPLYESDGSSPSSCSPFGLFGRGGWRLANRIRVGTKKFKTNQPCLYLDSIAGRISQQSRVNSNG